MMNAVVKPYHEMCLNSSELIVPRDTYQRALHPARVARIAKEFDDQLPGWSLLCDGRTEHHRRPEVPERW